MQGEKGGCDLFSEISAANRVARKLCDLSKKTTDRKRSSRLYRRTPQSTAHGMEQAQRWLKDGLAATGPIATDLPQMKGSDPRKLSPSGAASETDDGLAGMDRDAMRSAANVTQQLHWLNRAKVNATLPLEMQGVLSWTPKTGPVVKL